MCYAGSKERTTSRIGYFYEQLSLPPTPPKHDPCRLFKKGDMVQVVERNGRTLTCFPVGRIKVGDIVTVAENETGDVFIKVLTEDGHEMMAPWFMLELVTPVEEQEPYIAYENLHVCAVMHRDEKDGKFIAVFFISHYGKTIARERAEAERDRLNAEWRKEQQP